MLVEIAAAFDHLSRHWKYGQDEEACVKRAAGHLKRGSFDTHKLILKGTMDNYGQLARVDTSAIDNGEFDKQCIRLIRQIRTEAVYARTCEGDAERDWHLAFDAWDSVWDKCINFSEQFYGNEHVNWAKRRGWVDKAGGFLLAVVAGLVGLGIVKAWSFCWSWYSG